MVVAIAARADVPMAAARAARAIVERAVLAVRVGLWEGLQPGGECSQESLSVRSGKGLGGVCGLGWGLGWAWVELGLGGAFRMRA